MKRLLASLLVCVLLQCSSGCGKIFVRGALESGGIAQTASGFVGTVQFSNVSSNGVLINVTFVTLLLNGTSNNLPFCGDQRNQFPMDQFVRTSFMPGQPCDEVLTIVIGIN